MLLLDHRSRSSERLGSLLDLAAAPSARVSDVMAEPSLTDGGFYSKSTRACRRTGPGILGETGQIWRLSV